MYFKDIPEKTVPFPTTLRNEVENSLKAYLAQLKGMQPTDVYRLVLEQVEVPLFKIIMEQARNNKSRAAAYMGMNRATFVKKFKYYGIKSM